MARKVHGTALHCMAWPLVDTTGAKARITEESTLTEESMLLHIPQLSLPSLLQYLCSMIPCSIDSFDRTESPGMNGEECAAWLIKS